MRRDIDLRVSDTDREDVADVLKRHYLAGRLSEAEFDARVDAAYTARYESQLVALLRDLPAAVPATPAASGRRRPSMALVAGGTAAIGVAAVLLAMPDGLIVPLLLGAVMFTAVMAVAVAPVAIPLAIVAWIVHAVTRPRPPRQITLPPPPGPRRF